jgi:hypothetical protein
MSEGDTCLSKCNNIFWITLGAVSEGSMLGTFCVLIHMAVGVIINYTACTAHNHPPKIKITTLARLDGLDQLSTMPKAWAKAKDRCLWVYPIALIA